MSVKVFLKLVGSGVSLALLVSVFSAISVIGGFDETETMLMQLLAFSIAAILLLIYMKRKGSSLRDFGFSFRQVDLHNYLFALVIVSIQPVIIGLKGGLTLGSFLLLCVQMIIVGFVEEVLFRGVFFNLLKGAKLQVFLLASSLIFGLLHFVAGLDPYATLAMVCLQVLNAVLLGLVFAVIYYRYQNIYFVILFHGAFNIGAMLCTTSHPQKEFIAVLALIGVYLVFLLYLGIVNKTLAIFGRKI